MPEIKNIYELDQGLSEAQIAELNARSLRGESVCGFTEEQIEARKKEEYEFECERLRDLYRGEQFRKKELEEKEAQRKAKQDERDEKQRAAQELKQSNIMILNQQIANKAKRDADAACNKLLANMVDLSNALGRMRPGDSPVFLSTVRSGMEELLKRI